MEDATTKLESLFSDMSSPMNDIVKQNEQEMLTSMNLIQKGIAMDIGRNWNNEVSQLKRMQRLHGITGASAQAQIADANLKYSKMINDNNTKNSIQWYQSMNKNLGAERTMAAKEKQARFNTIMKNVGTGDIEDIQGLNRALSTSGIEIGDYGITDEDLSVLLKDKGLASNYLQTLGIKTPWYKSPKQLREEKAKQAQAAEDARKRAAAAEQAKKERKARAAAGWRGH